MRVVLLHAFPFDERMWEAQRPVLTGHQPDAPRLYPLGESMDDWARAVAAAADGPFAVVGVSMGGYCAQRLLVHADVHALLLVGSRAEADPPERRGVRDETIRLIREEGVDALWEAQRPRLFSEDAPEEVVGQARELALAQDAGELATGVAAMRDRPDSIDLVREADARLLVTVGEHDPFFSVDEAEALATAARRGRSRVFPGCGHLPSLERADEFNSVLEEFLDDV